MPDISKHPILRQISELVHSIEVCGASPALTEAVSKAYALYEPVEALVDAKTATLDATTAPELSYGQRAVGVKFNPGGSSAVNEIKQRFADVIDSMHNLRTTTTDPEVKRMASVAITEAQTAQMWAVKATTWTN